MRMLRQEAKRNDVNKWVESFLSPNVEQASPVSVPSETSKANQGNVTFSGEDVTSHCPLPTLRAPSNTRNEYLP